MASRERVSCHPAPVDRLAILAVRRQRRLEATNGVDADFCLFNGTEAGLQALYRPQPANDTAPLVEPGSIIRPPLPPWPRSSDDEPPDAA